MLSYNWILIFLTIFFRVTLQISTPESESYVAGVVEFSSESDELPIADRVRNALDAYLAIIESEEAADVDILVFPESTLNSRFFTSYVPEPENFIVPCNNDYYEEIVREISCAARNTKKYIIINLTEKSDCTEESQEALNDTRPCSADGISNYNANVVFDRNGTVISRYRKYNLFGEVGINTTLISDVSTFTTDFNVTFGHFICFDLMFFTPAMMLIQSGITDIIFPTMWFSQIPFLSAVQIQANWAYTHDVNFLAAGASNPDLGSTGSGIYAGKLGSLVSVMSPKPLRQLYTAIVPKKQFRTENTVVQNQMISSTPLEMTDLKLKRDRIDNYVTKVLPLHSENVQETLCYGDDLCCDFNINIGVNNVASDEVAYKYRLTVFDGVRTFDVKTAGIVMCGLWACTNDELSSCGTRFNNSDKITSEVVFKSINIFGRFRSNNLILTLPNTLDNTIMPIDLEDFNYFESDTFYANENYYKNITMQLTNPHDDILTFAIYGRDFNKDGMPVSPALDGASKMNNNMFFVSITIMFVIRYLF